MFKQIYKKRKLIYIFIILALIIYSFRITTIFDEDYSMILVNKSFLNLIKYDSLDVHPPLFYILLKLFLNITTFWTNSFVIKILFARIFSILISIGIINYLIRILFYLHIYINKCLLFISFLIIPGVISFTYEFLKIRMYSLSALWIVMLIYELIKYMDNKKNSQLIIIGILLICNEYTNYYSAMISFLFIAIFLLRYFITHKKILNQIIYLILFVVLIYIPWMPVLFKQISLSKYHQLPAGLLKQWIATLIFICIFIYPLIWARKHINKRFYNIFFDSFVILISLFIFMSIFSIIYRPVFQFRYLYPIFIPYSFFAITIIIIMLDKYHNQSRYKKIFILSIISFLFILCGGSYISQITYYNKGSVSLMRQFHYFKTTKMHDIYLHSINDPDDGFNLEKVIYLSKMHKVAVTPNIKESLNNPSYKEMFSHINKYLRN